MNDKLELLAEHSIINKIEEDDENLFIMTKIGIHELRIVIRKHDSGNQLDEIDIYINRNNCFIGDKEDIQIANIDLGFIRKMLPVCELIEDYSKNETV